MARVRQDAVLAALPMAAARAKMLRDRGPILSVYRDDPVAFVHDMFPDVSLADYQEEILSLLPKGRVAVYGPHGLGKTMVQSMALLWFSLTRENLGIDWKAPTTASAWRQLTHYLWPEIRKWSRQLNWKKLQRGEFNDRAELLALNLKLQYGEAFALASDNEASLEGAHADSLFFMFDESKTIPAKTWDAIEGAFSGTGEALALACSTPGEESGRFYEICSRKAGYEDWQVVHVTLDDAIRNERIDPVWAEQRRLQWGEGSSVYANRVLGEFASSASDGVIPLSWVERAVERWNERAPEDGLPLTTIGVDVGGGGDGGDLTTIALRGGPRISELRRFGTGDTMETAGRVLALVRAHDVLPVIDVIGIGAGVVSRLREQDVEVDGFNAAERVPPEFTDSSGELGFANYRAWGWWNLREMLDPTNNFNIELPDDDLLIGDLTAPHWKVQSGGRIIIESKDDIRKRLGRSTDSGDAVMMAYTRNGQGNDVVYNTNREDLREMVEDLNLGGDIWGKVW